MKEDGKRLPRIGLFIFFIGYLLGMVIIGISTFGDFEAYMFQFHIGFDGDETLKDLDCPVMMASSETETITATFKNPSDNRISPSVWAQVSDGFFTVVRDYKENLFIESGESKQLQWTITADDAVFGHWVLFKVHVYSQYPLPSSDGICGVFVANMFGFTGDHVYIISLVGSVLLMGAGVVLLNYRAPKRKKGKDFSRITLLLGGAVTIGLILTFIGSYLALFSGAIFIISAVALITFLLWR